MQRLRKHDRKHAPSRHANALSVAEKVCQNVTGASWQESLLCSAMRCNLGVEGASALKSMPRWVCSPSKQRDEPFSDAEHEAVPTMRFASSGDMILATRSGR